MVSLNKLIDIVSEHALFFEMFEKMRAILLYRFAAHKQIGTHRRQKFDLFYVKFSAEVNEVTLFFSKQQEVAKKWLKLK